MGCVEPPRGGYSAAEIISPEQVHAALIDQVTFTKTPALMAASTQPNSPQGLRTTSRTYLFRGLVFCAACDRRWKAPIYVREDRIIDRVDGWVDGAFAPGHVTTRSTRPPRTPPRINGSALVLT